MLCPRCRVAVLERWLSLKSCCGSVRKEAGMILNLGKSKGLTAAGTPVATYSLESTPQTHADFQGSRPC